MTEAEWLGCTDPGPMLEFLWGKASERKLRLFGCACVNLVWSLIGEKPPAAVRAAERFADRLVTKLALRRARQQVRQQRRGLGKAAAGLLWPGRRLWGAYWLAEVVATENAHASVVAELNRLSSLLTLNDAGREAICRLLRDLFGNPFRPVALDPGCRTSNVQALAEAAYEERELPSGHLDPARLSVLADALEEAGCGDAELLSHLRGPGPHVRGCWAVDLVTGRS
jgi:hypothetical protein